MDGVDVIWGEVFDVVGECYVCCYVGLYGCVGGLRFFGRGGVWCEMIVG